MPDKFTIKVNADGGDMRDCKYQPKGADFAPGIRINPSDTYINKDRCHAILRELAKRSDESHNTTEPGAVKLSSGLYGEDELKYWMWELLKSKCQQTPMTDKERIEKARMELSRIYNSGMPFDLKGVWTDIGRVLKVLEGEQ